MVHLFETKQYTSLKSGGFTLYILALLLVSDKFHLIYNATYICLTKCCIISLKYEVQCEATIAQ